MGSGVSSRVTGSASLPFTERDKRAGRETGGTAEPTTVNSALLPSADRSLQMNPSATDSDLGRGAMTRSGPELSAVVWTNWREPGRMPTSMIPFEPRTHRRQDTPEGRETWPDFPTSISQPLSGKLLAST